MGPNGRWPILFIVRQKPAIIPTFTSMWVVAASFKRIHALSLDLDRTVRRNSINSPPQQPNVSPSSAPSAGTCIVIANSFTTNCSISENK